MRRGFGRAVRRHDIDAQIPCDITLACDTTDDHNLLGGSLTEQREERIDGMGDTQSVHLVLPNNGLRLR